MNIKKLDEDLTNRLSQKHPKMAKLSNWVSNHSVSVFGWLSVLAFAEAIYTWYSRMDSLFYASFVVFLFSGILAVLTRKRGVKYTDSFMTFLLIFCLATWPTPSIRAQSNDQGEGSVHADGILLGVCALAILGSIIIIGGCAIKKSLDKMPPPKKVPGGVFPGEDEEEPPNPPTPGNTNSVPKKPTRKLSAPVDSVTGVGMARWDLTQSSYALASPEKFKDPVGNTYTDLITVTILGQPDLNTEPKPVGSRMYWLSLTPEEGGKSTVNSALVVYYDGQGNPRSTNYFLPGRPDCPLTFNTELNRSQIELTDEEIGENKFFRLATPIDRIGILTND